MEEQTDFVRPSDLVTDDVPDHDGTPIANVGASLVKTGHGFEETLAIMRMHIPIGARVMVLVPARCVSHEYDIATEGAGQNKHEIDEFDETAVLEAEGVMLLDPDLVQKVYKQHSKRIEQERERVEAERKSAKDAAEKKKRGEFPMDLPDPTTEDNGKVTSIKGAKEPAT
jgi:hypothetical protein